MGEAHKFFLITLRAPDIHAAAAFYRHALGLTPLAMHTERPHFQLDDTILVIQPDTPGHTENPDSPPFPGVAITVPDLDQAIQRLKQHRVELPWGIESSEHLRWVRFYDPAGNLVELVQSQPEVVNNAPIPEFYTDYLERTRQLFDQIKLTLSELPPEGLDWIPAPGENSLAVLAVHVAGAYRYWFSDVIAGKPSGRDREAEFRTSNQPLSRIFDHLEGSLQLLTEVLSRLQLDELASTRLSTRDGKTYRVGLILLHTYEHTALHLGHMQTTRQLWEAGFHAS